MRITKLPGFLRFKPKENGLLAHVLRSASTTISAIFDWPGVKTLAATTGTAPTFTRATSATFEDFEGLIKTVDSSEPRFQGARRVENIVSYSEDFSDSSWLNNTAGLTSGAADPDGGTTAWTFTANNTTSYLVERALPVPVAGTVLRCSIWVRRRTGTGHVFVYSGGDAYAQTEISSSLTTEWQRFSLPAATTNGAGFNAVGVRVNTTSDEVDIWHPQMEIVTGQANKNPSEYVSTGVATGSELVNTNTANWARGIFSIDGTLQYSGNTFTATAGAGDTAISPRWVLPISTVIGSSYVFAATIGGNAGAFNVSPNSSGTSAFASLTATGSLVFTAIGTTTYLVIANNGAAGSTMEVTAGTVKQASHGANVDGVQYFDTLNANTVSGNVVTEATGSALTAATTQFGELHGVATDYFSSPNIVTTWGELDIRVRATVDSITNNLAFLADKQDSFFLTLEPSGSAQKLRLRNHPSGGGVLQTLSINLPSPILSVRTWFRGTLDAATGDIKFYTADGSLEDPALTDYVQLGPTQNIGATSIAVKTFPFTSGTFQNGNLAYPFDGEIYRAQVFNEIDGTTPIADFTPGSHVSGPTLVSSTTNAVWTLNGNATVFHPPVDSDGPFGYLSEKASTNLVLQSEDFTTSWMVSGNTVTADAAIAPDGTLSADKLINNAGLNGASAYFYQSQSLSGQRVLSIYAKAAGQNFIRLDSGLWTSNNYVIFSLLDGSVTQPSPNTWTTASSTAVGNGWYRLQLETNSTTSQYTFLVSPQDAGTGTGGAANGTDGVFIWGAQLELGTYPTSYIPTTTTAVARNADVLTAGDMITDAAGSVYAEASSIWATSTGTIYALSRDSANLLYKNAGLSNQIRTYDGTTAANSAVGASYQDSPASFASTWGTNLTAYLRGATAGSVSYDGTFGAGNLYIGNKTTYNHWDGTVRDVKVFNSELTAEQVADLSPDPVPPAPAQFDWLGQTTLVPTIGDTPTFTRATSAYFEDFEGLVKTVIANEPRFVGARRVENLLTDSENLNAWSKDASITLTSGVIDPLGGTTAWTVTASAVDQRIYQGIAGAKGIPSLWIRRRTGTGNINLFAAGGYAGENNLTASLTSEWQRMVGTALTDGYWILKIAASGDEVDVWHPQWEEVTGQANQNPSEYVSTGVGTGSELVTNGTFDGNINGWGSSSGAVIAYSSGQMSVGSTSWKSATQAITGLIVGATYEVSADFVTTGGIETVIRFNTFPTVFRTYATSGTLSGSFVATVSSDTLLVGTGNGTTGTTLLDNITFKQASHGANVDGVKYFDTLNANTVSSNVVTEATGSALTPATTQFGELHGAGSDYFSSPNIVTTWDELDVRVRASVDSITAGHTFLADKAVSFFLAFRPSGSTQRLNLRSFPSGGGSTDAFSITFPTSLLSVRTWFRATLDAATGDVKFYTAEGSLENPALSDYVQLGTTINIGAISIAVNTQPFTSGTYLNGTLSYPFDGEIYRTQIFNTVDGTTPVVDFTPGSYVSGSTLVSSNTGETWTLQGNATVFQPPVDASGPFGYLSEKSTANCVPQSQDFTDYTTTQGTSVTADAATAPDGTTTMDRLVVDSSSGSHDVMKLAVSIVTNTNYTTSVYMKDDGAGFGGICFGLGYRGISVVANLSTGVVTATNAGSSGTIVATGCDPVGNGIYRVWISGNILSGGSVRAYAFACNAAVPANWATGRPQYTAVLGEDILIWGRQVELGTYPTSYIPTTTTAVTRNADSLIAGDMVTDAAGTAYAEASSIWVTEPGAAWVLDNGASGRLLYRNAGAADHMYAYDGVSAPVITSAPSYYNRVAPFASTWGDNLIVYKDGTAGTVVPYDGAMGGGNLFIGGQFSGSWNGTIRHVKILSTELTAAEVAEL